MTKGMANEIDVSTLQAWLAEGRPVEVIDIRPRQDYEAWHIPGSRNVDVYAAINRGSPGALADFVPEGPGPVVAVCYVGETSVRAAAFLRARGIQAVSLAGGMQAWSLAWNQASALETARGARVVQVRRTGKGCLSYVVAADGQAVVIDPSLPPQVYQTVAENLGARIAMVLDTHIHADHLSRARALTAEAGAKLLLPVQDRVTFEHETVAEGDEIPFGESRLRALQTPGHTFESMSFLLDDEMLFTGDTLFVDSLGRPDLKADAAETRARAQALHRTLRRLTSLDESLLVLPGHSGQPIPFDGVPIAAPLGEVVQKVQALGYDEETFVDWILQRIPPTPPNYERIVRLNETGQWPSQDPAVLEAGANRCAVA